MSDISLQQLENECLGIDSGSGIYRCSWIKDLTDHDRSKRQEMCSRPGPVPVPRMLGVYTYSTVLVYVQYICT